MVKNMRKKHRYRGGGKVGVGTEILKSVVSQETPINRNLIKGKVKRELRRNGDQRHSLDWAESVERDYYGGDSPLREMGIGQLARGGKIPGRPLIRSEDPTFEERKGRELIEYEREHPIRSRVSRIKKVLRRAGRSEDFQVLKRLLEKYTPVAV